MPKSAYEKSGVSIDRGNQAVERIRSMVKSMGVQEIGKFTGRFILLHPFPSGLVMIFILLYLLCLGGKT